MIQGVWQKSFGFLGQKPVVVEASASELSSDAGLLPVREFDGPPFGRCPIGFTEALAEALKGCDSRYEPFVEHTLEEMVRSRIYGILADYEDQNDHDRPGRIVCRGRQFLLHVSQSLVAVPTNRPRRLRSDPVFKLIAGRSPEEEELAYQSTLSRFENVVDIPALNRLRDVMIDAFIASFERPPARLTFDIDIFDDPTHGGQQLTLFNGYYGQYQYEPRAITCADNDQVVMVGLLYGSAHPALGAEDDIESLVTRLRAAWPGVDRRGRLVPAAAFLGVELSHCAVTRLRDKPPVADIELRADSGFGVPRMDEVCERLGVWSTFGLKLNPVLKRNSQPLLDEAVHGYEATGEKQRLFCVFPYQAGSWPQPRTTIVKCEAHAQGTNRRAVVTNRLGAFVLPGACYDEYANRGESENRNKELKCDLKADRLSDHRYLANLFRLYLHAAALNLLVRLRQVVADPPEPEPNECPVEALPQPQRRRWFNRRREHDPLGEGQASTWRTRLFKVAAEVTVSARRILVRLSGCWPHLDHYQQVSDRVLAYSVPPSGPG